ncbi:MAG: hypothetical protein ACRD2E_02105 [Terriglobales bacterium]
MDEIEAVHTAARRFCLGEIWRWGDRYSALKEAGGERVATAGKISWAYSDAAYQIFPRKLLAQALLDEVERIVPALAGSGKRLCARLTASAEAARAATQATLRDPRAAAPISAEAEEFQRWVASSGTLCWQEVRPLAFHRTLDATEGRAAWERAAVRWGLRGNCWFPLTEGEQPADVLVFHRELFGARAGAKLLVEALAERGIQQVLHLHAWGPANDYETALSLLAMALGVAMEEYFTAGEADWLVYASHESSVAIGGEWLAARFKEAWPDWRGKTYLGPFSTSDSRGCWR